MFHNCLYKNNHSDEVKAAGSTFTNGSHILAGYQPYKQQPFISGIGGSCLPGEDYNITAIRETIEELFDITDIPVELIILLCSICPKNAIIHNNYYNMIYDFEDLERMLSTVRNFGIVSPLYDSIPKTVYELIINRKVLNTKLVEISHLTLLPLVNHNTNYDFVDKHLLDDMKYILSR